jgi:predicted  nucleic acid-binding Zn-ribbon protein
LLDQLKRLEELQRYDAQIQELTNSLNSIPTKLQATQSDLARVEALLATERGQLVETQRYYTEQKSQLQTDETHVAGAKTKLSAAKNSKEYMAAQREIETSRESVQNREAEVAKRVDAIQAKEKLLEDRANDVKALRDSIEKDGEVARARMAEIQAKIDAIKVERNKIATQVRPDVLKRYGAIRMRRGLAVVSVKNGTCLGCNMNVPPQLYNVLQRGTSLETCPYCNRIVYWDELMKKEEAAAAKTDSASPSA